MLNEQFSRTVGFSLIEMMIVFIIMGVIVAASVPNYRSMVANNQAAALSNSLNASLKLARSESIKHQTPVSVCASNNATNPTGCNLGVSDWENGWIVVKDPNSNGSGTEILGVQQPIGSGFVKTASSGQFVTFQSAGFVPIQRTFTITPDGCSGNLGRELVVERAGYVTINRIACP